MILIIIFFSLVVLGAVLPNTGLKKVQDILLRNYGWWALLLTIVAVSVDMMGHKDGKIYNECLMMFVALIMTSPLSIIYTIRAKHKEKQQGMSYGQAPAGYISQTPVHIPDSRIDTLAEREKVIRKFNKKYNLMLTDTQISNIVNGSFQCREWEEEILAMSKPYDTFYMWFDSPRKWLRVYLKVFNVQNISTDFSFQREICLKNFDEVFQSADIGSCWSVEDCVERINRKFLTNFDESTFMIAYRFLQENGKEYPLPKMGIVENESEVDRLLNKYKNNNETNYNLK